MPITVTEIKNLYQGIIAPGDDATFLRILQEAEILLLQSGKWLWAKARVTLTATNGIITLDPAYAAIIGAQVEGHPTPISVADFEFFPDGPGDVNVQGGHLKLIDQGLNSSEQRTYKLTGAEPSPDIVAIVHKAPATLYDPDIPDSDLPADASQNLTCPDMYALKRCMLGIVFEEAHNPGGSEWYEGRSVRQLNGRENRDRGNAQSTPNLRPMGRGVKTIRSFR